MRKSNYLWLLLVAVLLLPAQEMAAKKKKEKEVTDRELWAGVLYQMAAPVLSNMSEGKLQENMQVELSPTWDGRDKRVTYMECFGRLMAGLAPWLSLPDDDTAEGKQRRQLREWALKSYAQAVDPESQDYLLWRKEGQPLVDAAYVAESFLRGYDALWVPLDSLTKRRYIEEFTQLRRVDPPAPQIRLIIRLLQDLHPKIHPKIKSDSLIIILYIKHYLQVLNNLTIMMPCGILLYFLLFCLFLSNKYVTLKYHFGLDWN